MMNTSTTIVMCDCFLCIVTASGISLTQYFGMVETSLCINSLYRV